MIEEKSNLLLVDDEEINLLLLSTILKNKAYNILTSTNPKDTIRLAKEFEPDLILMDIRMPGMSGFEVCDALKKDPEVAQIPIIIVSSLIESDEKVKAFQLGAVDYITKPYQPDEVIARVHTHLKLNRQSKELKVLNESLNESQKKLIDYTSNLQSARFDERTLLATEIHDNVGQTLVALKINFGIIQKKIANQLDTNTANSINNILTETFQLVDNSIHAVRGLMYHLRPEQIEVLGFVEAVKIYLQQFQKLNHINCKFECSVENFETDLSISILLFQLMQEVFFSVANSENLSDVLIKYYSDKGQLYFEIEYKETEASVVKRGNETSFGLLFINQKLTEIGGKLTYETTSSNSNKIVVTIKEQNH